MSAGRATPILTILLHKMLNRMEWNGQLTAHSSLHVVTFPNYTQRYISLEIHFKYMKFCHSYICIGRHHTTPDILFVNFVIKKHDNIYVHINVRNQFGSFIIHNFISHIRNTRFRLLSSENNLGLLINRINIYFLIGYVVK